MDTNFKLSIGMNDNAGAQQNAYTRVNFDIQIQAQKINAITKQLQEKTGKFRVPALIFDFPQSAKDMNMRLFNSVQGQINYEVIQKEGRVYKCLDLISSHFINAKKKVEKLFSSLTELDNKIFLHLDLYNVDGFQKKLQQKQDYAMAVFLQKSKIQGKFTLDPKFFDVLTKSIATISPKFAQSPLMAVIPMFGGFDCQLEMDSLNQLQIQNQKQIFSGFSYEHPDDDQQGLRLKKQFKNKDKVYIYFSFGTMVVFKIQLQVRMFAFYNCLL